MPEFRYYIAVDFGSESMAAAFLTEADAYPQDIDLQSRAATVRSGCDILKEEDGTTRSRRLRTRIALGKHPLTNALLDEQAAVDLPDASFEYFHFEAQEYSRDVLPNLKLLYQEAVRTLLPDGTASDVRPEKVLATVVLQILTRIVLVDPGLLDHAKKHVGTLRGSAVHLLLTIPNVYSVSHATKLQKVIADKLVIGGEPVAAVETMYESDAAAYYLMFGHPGQHPTRTASDVIDAAKKRRRKINVTTIDIGRGTTDVSFAMYEWSDLQRGWLYDLKARTGRAHGGGRLSYLIASALQGRINAAFDAWLTKLSPVDRKAALTRRPSLTTRFTTGIRADAVMISAAERYIERLKRDWDEYLRLTEGEEQRRELRTKIVEYYRTVLHDQVGAAADDFMPAFEAALTVPSVLDRELIPLKAKLSSFFKGAKKKTTNASAPATPEDIAFGKQLAAEIDTYVRRNASEVIAWLGDMVEASEGMPFDDVLQKHENVILVAGQGSQFKRLRKALEEQIEGKNFDAKGGNVVFLLGRDAKNACCYGALLRYRLNIINTHPDRVMGTYGFLYQAGEELDPLNMDAFQMRDSSVTVDLNPNTFYFFVYSPRYFKPEPMSRSDVRTLIRTGGSLAYLWPIPIGGQVTVTNHGGEGIHIRYPGHSGLRDTRQDAAAFGDVTETGEQLYSRSWPEVLEPMNPN